MAMCHFKNRRETLFEANAGNLGPVGESNQSGDILVVSDSNEGY
jgi:hypothetical protein